MNNVLLSLRCEIVCFLIMLLLLAYNMVYIYRSERAFLKICLVGLGHVLFDGVTLFTVNNIELVGEPFNRIMHFFMYFFAVWFVCEIFCYILKQLIPNTVLRKYLWFARLPFLLFTAAMPFLEIEYYPGAGTMYSLGICAITGFGLTTAYSIVGTGVLLWNIRKIERNVVVGLLPVNIFALVCMLLQIAVHELLFTGAAVTIVTVGLFFTVANPAAHFMKQAYIDLDTGIKNRNCYNEDMKKLEKAKETVLCAVCDLNGLKAVNDRYGHIAGDELIRAAADVLSGSLRSAYNVYRIGGDEFVAVFLGVERERVEAEIAGVREGCGSYAGLKSPLSIAIGLAGADEDEFSSVFDIVSLADRRMYENKLEIKKSVPPSKVL